MWIHADVVSVTEWERMSDSEDKPSKRPRLIENIALEYRCSRSNSLIDVGSTLRRAAMDPADRVALSHFVERLTAPRVSVFTIIHSDLGQTFSLDNGVAVQELVLMWLKLFNGKKGPISPLMELKKSKQFQIVWWEARVVRIFTWAPELRPALVELCLPQRLLYGNGCAGAICCSRQPRPRRWSVPTVSKETPSAIVLVSVRRRTFVEHAPTACYITCIQVTFARQKKSPGHAPTTNVLTSPALHSAS